MMPLRQRATLLLLMTLTPLLSSCDHHSKKENAIPIKKTTAPSTDTPPEGTKKIQCPALSDITKDPSTQRWSATSDWKSYDTSFSTELTHFYGAQWSGAAVGQIFCLYKDDHPNSFYVMLAYHTLAIEPQSGKWGELKSGVKNCVAGKQQNCFFYVKLPKKETDFYGDIQKLRKN